MSSLSDEENTNDEENEETYNLIHTVLLKEVSNGIREDNHEDTTNNNRSSHYPEVFRDSHCRKDGVKGENEVHYNDRSNDQT